MKKEEYYMIREYNQYSLCKHLNNGMSISVTTIYAKYSISIISITGKITTTNYRNGKEARKEFYKYKRKK